MQLPQANAGTDAYLFMTDGVEGAAEAWMDAEILSKAEIQAVTDALAIVAPAGAQLRQAAGVTGEAERAAAKARARFRVRDVILDLKVMGASSALYNGLCGRSYAHPTYRLVFADENASAITGAKLREEPEIAEAMLGRFKKTEDYGGKQAAADELERAIALSVTVRTAVEAAEKAENEAGDDEILARLEVRKALQRAYGMLLAAFPGKKAFVESFFARKEKGGAAAAKVEGGETSSIGGTPAPEAAKKPA
jgi:hypothetical protein